MQNMSFTMHVAVLGDAGLTKHLWTGARAELPKSLEIWVHLFLFGHCKEVGFLNWNQHTNVNMCSTRPKQCVANQCCWNFQFIKEKPTSQPMPIRKKKYTQLVIDCRDLYWTCLNWMVGWKLKVLTLANNWSFQSRISVFKSICTKRWFDYTKHYFLRCGTHNTPLGWGAG